MNKKLSVATLSFGLLFLSACSYNASAARSTGRGISKLTTTPFRFLSRPLPVLTGGYERYTKCSEGKDMETGDGREFLVVASVLVGLNLDQACLAYGFIAEFVSGSGLGDQRRMNRIEELPVGKSRRMKFENPGVELPESTIAASLELVAARALPAGSGPVRKKVVAIR